MCSDFFFRWVHPEFKDEDEAGERGENMVREMDVNSGEEAVVEMDNNRDNINKRELESKTWRYGNVEMEMWTGKNIKNS